MQLLHTYTTVVPVQHSDGSAENLTHNTKFGSHHTTRAAAFTVTQTGQFHTARAAITHFLFLAPQQDWRSRPDMLASTFITQFY